MNRPLRPAARDAALTRVTRLTTGIVVASVVGTIGLGATIATADAPSESGGSDYADPAQPAAAPGDVAPAEDRPESSSGDEDTTSGGS